MLDAANGGLDDYGDRNDQIYGVRPEIDGKRSRIKSELPFPYVALDEVTTIAQVMQQCGGVPLTRDQLASKFEASSYFSVKISSALLFNVVERRDSRYALSDIGRSIASGDGNLTRLAYVKAFLSVELYAKLVDHFRGMKLPGKDGIEDALVEFGVTPKLKRRARWAFEKSASFAGFYNPSRDRLVRPILGDDAAPNAADSSKAIESEDLTLNAISAHEHVVAAASENDPSKELLIRGMLNRLPKIGTKWEATDRARWLRRLSNNLAELYDPADDTEIKITVETDPDKRRHG